ncbi:MAG: hypothetical protein U9M92_00795 [Patescibacteria group bacterium]|nr:hypothetical protein [Patescibacteria group bacterium]
MDEKSKKLIEVLKQTHLSSGERKQLCAELVADISKMPASTEVLAPQASGPSWPWQYFAWQRVAWAIALVLIIGTGSLSAFAEQSLPGDRLYPMKLSFNEGIVRLTAPALGSPVSEVEVKLVKRRLEEAEKLASQERLSPILKEQIKIQVAKQVAVINRAEPIAAVSAPVAVLTPVSESDDTIPTAVSELGDTKPVDNREAGSMKVFSTLDDVTAPSVTIEPKTEIQTEAGGSGGVSGDMPMTKMEIEKAEALSGLKEVLEEHQTIVEELELPTIYQVTEGSGPAGAGGGVGGAGVKLPNIESGAASYGASSGGGGGGTKKSD